MMPGRLPRETQRVGYKPLRQPDPTTRSASEFVSSREQPVHRCHTSSTLQRVIDSRQCYITSIFSIQHSLPPSYPPIPDLSCTAHPFDHQHTHSLTESKFPLTEEAWSFQARSPVYKPHAWPPGPICQRTAPAQKNNPQCQKSSWAAGAGSAFLASRLQEKDLSPWICHIAVTDNHWDSYTGWGLLLF